MNVPNLFYSFRVRLMLVLAALMIATLGVQYFLYRRAEKRVARLIAEQEQSLAAGISLAVQSLSSTDRLKDLDKEGKFFLLEKQAERVTNVLIVNDEGGVEGRLDEEDLIDDSLDPEYIPQRMNDGTDKYFKLSEARLPRLVNPGQSVNGSAQLSWSSPNTMQPVAGEPRAFVISAETNKGRTYIIVVLGSANTSDHEPGWHDAQALLPTLIVLLVATLVAAILVWRFTQPIQDLSEAAQRVAAGHFDFRVPAADRRDEMGALATVFNEMIARLGRLRELEMRLHQVERSAVVGRLASAIAHEIRNPLNYINLTLDYLRTSFAPEDEKKHETFERLANQLKTEVARINTRISEFLNYTRPSKLELRPLDLRATVEDALRMVEVQAAESGVELHIEQSGDIPTVQGDAQSLRSVLTNLIINGLQAINSGGGRLTIALSAEDNHARIDVTDTGQGIAPENISQVFEPYFSTKETGTGLGLAIVKKAVDDHGGTISVRSKIGEGTTFTITLPTSGVTGDR